MTSLPRAIRPADERDLPLILNSWLKSYRNAPACTTVPNDIYFSEDRGQKARILDLLSNGQTLIACDPEDDDCVYGWICTEEPGVSSVPPVVHYVYVKQAYRLRGVARGLLKAAGVGDAPFWATHETIAARKTGIPYIYNPYHLATQALVPVAMAMEDE